MTDDDNHTTFDVAMVCDPSLSSADKGLLMFLLTYHGQLLSIEDIAASTPDPDERRELPARLEALAAAGWLISSPDRKMWAPARTSPGRPA